MSRYAAQSARRFARNLARKSGVVLRRFRLIDHSDEDLIGREWKADGVRSGFATVWKPTCCVNEVEGNGLCYRRFGGHLFVIRVRP
jgi:hypothetical protein